jgi:hypothetical protein
VLCTVKVYRSEIAGQEVKKEDKKKFKREEEEETVAAQNFQTFEFK